MAVVLPVCSLADPESERYTRPHVREVSTESQWPSPHPKSAEENLFIEDEEIVHECIESFLLQTCYQKEALPACIRTRAQRVLRAVGKHFVLGEGMVPPARASK